VDSQGYCVNQFLNNSEKCCLATEEPTVVNEQTNEEGELILKELRERGVRMEVQNKPAFSARVQQLVWAALALVLVGGRFTGSVRRQPQCGW
jgi:hypothetical protein